MPADHRWWVNVNMTNQRISAKDRHHFNTHLVAAVAADFLNVIFSVSCQV